MTIFTVSHQESLGLSSGVIGAFCTAMVARKDFGERLLFIVSFTKCQVEHECMDGDGNSNIEDPED